MRGYGPFPEGAEPTAPLAAPAAVGGQPPAAAYPALSAPAAAMSPAAETPTDAISFAQSADAHSPDTHQGTAGPSPHLGPAGPGPHQEAAGSGPHLGPAGPGPHQGAVGAGPHQTTSTGPARSQVTPTGPHRLTPMSASPYNADPTSADPYPAGPTSASPYSGAPTSASPYSGSPAAASRYPGSPTPGSPTPGSPTPGSSTPGSPTPGSPTPGSSTPGSPAPGSPTLGSTTPAGPTAAGLSPAISYDANPYDANPQPSTPYGPFHGDSTGTPAQPYESHTTDPYDFSAPSSFSGRRIEPSPPPDRNRLIIGIVAGLVAGLLLFGTGGWLVGRAGAPNPKPEPGAGPDRGAQTATPSGALGIFEQSQVALNQPHFASTGLVTLAQGWQPYLSSCARSGERGGPSLNAGEKTRVRCTLDGMSAIFVEYRSITDRDKARVKALGQNVDARALTPGVGPAAERPAPSGRTTGNYVEYAYKLTERGTTRTVSGIWWDDAQTPVAAYLLAYWKEGVGESWEPMRDLWSRYA
jgi:hypothetical protein